MSAQTTKLRFLLRSLWQSPLFGDSFPPMDEQAFLLQFESMVPAFVEKLVPVLRVGLPDATDEEIDDLVGQLTPKSLAFCAAIAAGEVEDTNSLVYASLAIALSYWADQSMDRGDAAMFAALQALNHSGNVDTANLQLRARLSALSYIHKFAKTVTESPDDLPYVLQAIERDVLSNQVEVRLLSDQFKIRKNQDLIDVQAFNFVRHTTDGSGLMSAVSIIYAIYRCSKPDLPSLNEIYTNLDLMRLVRGPFNAAVRVFDDTGDWQIDLGQNPKWGIFTLNLFNQSSPSVSQFFLEYSEIRQFPDLYDQFLLAFAHSAPQSSIVVSRLYITFLRREVERIPPHFGNAIVFFSFYVKGLLKPLWLTRWEILFYLSKLRSKLMFSNKFLQTFFFLDRRKS
ncbi:MAG: hypothetical protein HXY38_00880 [Chloroflexi bacterium]|nr:hypothetical protein [Chloroflexota bacterium]